MKKTLINLITIGMLTLPIGERLFIENSSNSKKEKEINERYHAELFIKELEKERKGKIEYNGGLEFTLLEENKKVKIPTWKDLHVSKPSMCAEYARKLTLQFGY